MYIVSLEASTMCVHAIDVELGFTKSYCCMCGHVSIIVCDMIKCMNKCECMCM